MAKVLAMQPFFRPQHPHKSRVQKCIAVTPPLECRDKMIPRASLAEWVSSRFNIYSEFLSQNIRWMGRGDASVNKGAVTKPDDLSSVPRTHMDEGGNQLLKVAV